jgi:hypothetical protein
MEAELAVWMGLKVIASVHREPYIAVDPVKVQYVVQRLDGLVMEEYVY